MEYLDIDINKLKRIINSVKSGLEYPEIAKQNGLTREELKNVLKTFCEHYKCTIVKNEKDGTRLFTFEMRKEHKKEENNNVNNDVNNESKNKDVSKNSKPKKETKQKPKVPIPELPTNNTFDISDFTIERALELKQWCYENNRLPRNLSINPDEQVKTEELELYLLIDYIKRIIMRKYEENMYFEANGFKEDMKIFEVIVEIENKFNPKSKYRMYKDAFILKKWSDETGFKPEGKEANDKNNEDEAELKMFNLLKKIRRNYNSDEIPKEKKYYLKYVLEEVNSRNSKNDEKFLYCLKKQLKVEEINLSPLQIEILRGMSEGKSVNSLVKTTRLEVADIYNIINEFCKEYNCKIINTSKAKKGQREFILNEDENNLDER